MCFTKLEQVDTTQVTAYKVFGFDREDRLISAFTVSRKPGQFYTPSLRIKVDDDEIFFAFENMQFCLSAIIFRPHYWRLSSNILIALPVTLYGTIHRARYSFPNEDIQCCDPCYPAYCATEIVVHDSPEHRQDFYQAVVKQDLQERLRIMNVNLAAAYRAVLPSLSI